MTFNGDDRVSVLGCQILNLTVVVVEAIVNVCVNRSFSIIRIIRYNIDNAPWAILDYARPLACADPVPSLYFGQCTHARALV